MKSRWKDEYWLMLMQIYLKKPAGVKPLYSRDIIDLALELHIPPKYLYRKMFSLRRLDTPRIERLWKNYAENPRKLAKGVNMLRNMNGFNHPDIFYEGVDMNESFEKEFKAIPGIETLTPMMLVIILDLYFRLTPNTMVPETPEIITLAKTLGTTPEDIVDVMTVYQGCDPYLRRQAPQENPLTPYCREIWQRMGNGDPSDLAAYAAQLMEYYK